MTPFRTRAARSSWSLLAGDEIGPECTVERHLGGGRRCEVYLAWNHRRMGPTVIKVLRPSRSGSDRSRQALCREARLLATIDHPAVNRLLAERLDDERPHIELEYVPGRRLSRSIRGASLPPPLVASIGRDIASALAHLHRRGVVHLDVKPSNVIVGQTATLIDFSVARSIDGLNRIHGFVGTTAYMSPEQADPDLWPMIGPKSDVWGLGATLYCALAGPHPTAAPAREDPDTDARNLVQIIRRCLRTSPEARPTAQDLVEGFGEMAGGARPDGQAPPERRAVA